MIHSFTDGHLDCFQQLAVVNCATMNIGVHRFFWICVSGFLGYNPSSEIAGARDIKERINKWDLVKIKSFCLPKENSINMKREPTIWKNRFANDTLDKVLSLKYIKNSHESTPVQEDKQSNKKMGKRLEQTLFQGGYT